MNEAPCQRLLEAATAVIEGGWPDIVDATVLRHADRSAARRSAAETDVPVTILHFDAPLALLRQRVQQRATQALDASEANVAVLAWQLRAQERPRPDESTLAHVLPAAALPGPAPQVDWTPLLARLARAGHRAPCVAPGATRRGAARAPTAPAPG